MEVSLVDTLQALGIPLIYGGVHYSKAKVTSIWSDILKVQSQKP